MNQFFKRLAVFVLTLLLMHAFVGLANSGIFSFVHKDYDFVLRFSKGVTWYPELKKVTFFRFVLDRKGLGFEDAFLRVLEDMKYKTGIDPEVVTDAISNDILFASKGLDVNLMEFVAFDLNYYFELLKTLASNAIVVFETKIRKGYRGLWHTYSRSVTNRSEGTIFSVILFFAGHWGNISLLQGVSKHSNLRLKHTQPRNAARKNC